VVGGDTPIFDGKPPVALRLVATRTWDGSGNVLVRYEVSDEGLKRAGRAACRRFNFREPPLRLR